MTEDNPKADLSPFAIVALRGITPLLLAILVFIGTRTINSLDKLVDTVQAMQVSQAAEQATNLTERTSNAVRFAEILRMLNDHEERMRKVEARRCRSCPSES